MGLDIINTFIKAVRNPNIIKNNKNTDIGPPKNF
jgi:hypothetical protein